MSSAPPIEPPPTGILQYWRDWLSQDGLPFWSFWDNVRSWWAIRHLPNVMCLHFADLKRDLSGEMRHIAKFLDVEIAESRWPEIMEYCTFDWMKRNAQKTVPLGGVFWDGCAQTFINKGVNGRWEGILSADDIAAYEARAASELGLDCAHWLATGERRESPDEKGS